MAVVSTSPLVKHYTLEEFWALPEPKDRYAALGVRELWLVDTETRRVEVRDARDALWASSLVFSGNERILSDVLPTVEFTAEDSLSDVPSRR